MTDRAFVIDSRVPLIADTSVVINLIATQIGARILAAIPNEFVVSDVVVHELELGRSRGRTDADALQQWIRRKRVLVRRMSDTGHRIFEDLVSGSAAATLDDGEAATIACCSETGGIALIDERKAVRVCGDRFPDLHCASSVDVCMHPSVVSELGPAAVADAVFYALQGARMRVWPKQVDRVVDLIGVERARLCRSLPGSVRP